MSLDTFTPWTPDQPVVAVTFAQPDTMAVKVFGAAYDTPPGLGPLTRASFGRVMDHLWDRLRQPFTVEITETDGSRTTGTIDLSQPPAPPTPPASPRRALPDQPATAQPMTGPAPTVPAGPDAGLVPVEAAGLWPGERVCLGLVAADAQASQDGRVAFHVPRAALDFLPRGEVLIYGQASHAAILDYPLR